MFDIYAGATVPATNVLLAVAVAVTKPICPVARARYVSITDGVTGRMLGVASRPDPVLIFLAILVLLLATAVLHLAVGHLLLGRFPTVAAMTMLASVTVAVLLLDGDFAHIAAEEPGDDVQLYELSQEDKEYPCIY